jgi:hypothetical protein
MGDLGFVPLTSGRVSLIWGVLFSCTGATFSTLWSNPSKIGIEYSLSFEIYKHPSSSLTSKTSSSRLISMELISFYASLSCNIRMASISCL